MFLFKLIGALSDKVNIPSQFVKPDFVDLLKLSYQIDHLSRIEIEIGMV